MSSVNPPSSGPHVSFGRQLPSGHRANGAVPAGRVAPAGQLDTTLKIRLFGHPLRIQAQGDFGEGHLLVDDPRRLDQLSLALEALVITGLANNQELREAAQTVRDAHPDISDGEIMARLFPYLEFTPTSVRIYRPIPEMRVPEGAAKETWAHSWEPEAESSIGEAGPRDLSRFGQQDVVVGAYRAFMKHHLDRAIGHEPHRDLLTVWNTVRARHGDDFPFDDLEARKILWRIFQAGQIAEDDAEISLEVDDDEEAAIPGHPQPQRTLRFLHDPPAERTLSFFDSTSTGTP